MGFLSQHQRQPIAVCAEQLSLLKQFINRAETLTRWALPPWTEAGLWAPTADPSTRAQGAALLPTPGPTWPGGSREARPTRALAHSSFLLLWSAVLIMYPTSLAVISMTFSNYVLQPVFPNCIPPAAASRVLSMACLSECPVVGVGRASVPRTRPAEEDLGVCLFSFFPVWIQGRLGSQQSSTHQGDKGTNLKTKLTP